MLVYLHQLNERVLIGCCFDLAVQRGQNIAFEKVPPIVEQKIMQKLVVMLSNVQREVLNTSE
jgi:hypothetical protein